jgi:hypothetical protein
MRTARYNAMVGMVGSLIGIVLMPLRLGAGTVDCPVSSATKAEIVAYLTSERKQEDAECIKNALIKLSKFHDSTDSGVLASYLNFEMPSRTTGDNNGSVFTHPSWLGDRYPAIAALVEIGKPSIPAVIDAIGNSDTTEVAWRNAIETIRVIYRDDQVMGVRVLNDANRASPDPARADRLRRAARAAADKCAPYPGTSCKDILLDQDKINPDQQAKQGH